MPAKQPFDDFRFLLDNLPAMDREKAERVRSGMADGIDASETLLDLAGWLAGWTSAKLAVMRPTIAIFAGNHGVAARMPGDGTEATTAQMAEHCMSGGAPVGRICAAAGFGLKVFDLALDLPTADITRAAAMDERTCAATMAFGMEAIVGGADLVCLSDLGVGGEIAASAVAAAIFGEAAGAASADAGKGLVTEALAFHTGRLGEPFEVLRRLGGRELAAAAGAILAARMERIPVILDGYATTAAAAVLHALNPDALDHCRIACLSGLPGHERLAMHLGLRPILAGEYAGGAAGGALAVSVARAAAPLAEVLR
ncbi:MAG: nicotinate-nucleotide--dimethylbenzimidazole phosphoribosyltransferase [Rhizobiales bacterium]|nr:nicotinate-nucleotide--dimethylbenzimidazole phosphoribosyltransferase [Hyphomicrobiales bacterium]